MAKPKRLLRFNDLQAKGIADNRHTLKNLIKNAGFPVGRRMGPQRRAWTEDEVDAWIEALPSATDARPPLRGEAKRRTEIARIRTAGAR
jgi:predicted DNA-binding transcriptional regulator AlpA